MRGGKIEGTQLRYTKAISQLELSHAKYLSNLPTWDQYVVWVYTLGSQPVNRLLVGFPVSSKFEQRWAFELLSNWQSYGESKSISKSFRDYRRLFDDPSFYKRLDEQDKTDIARDLLQLYIKNLQRIILNAPVTKGDITVYKASTPYDPRLTTDDEVPFVLPQPPFNSTTYDPWFDFNAFLGSNTDTCCLWEILIPKGSHVLAIVHPWQAYLTEREILLPYGIDFTVLGSKIVDMSYYVQREAPDKTQDYPYYIGELYRHDSWEQRPTDIRAMRMLVAIYGS